MSDKAAAYAACIAVRDYLGGVDSMLPAATVAPSLTVGGTVAAFFEREETFAPITIREHGRYCDLFAADHGSRLSHP